MHIEHHLKSGDGRTGRRTRAPGWACRFALLLTVSVVAGCEAQRASSSAGSASTDAGASSGIERLDSAGIEIVTSPGTDRPLRWAFPEIFRLGGAPGVEGSFRGIQGPRRVASDARGNLYVLDGGRGLLHSFGPAGGHRWTVGPETPAGGRIPPGASLAVSPEGRSAVLDMERAIELRWDGEGSFLGERALPAGASVVAVELLEGGVPVRLHSSTSEAEEGAPPGRWTRSLVLNGEGEDADTLARLLQTGPRSASLDACGREVPFGVVERILSPGLVWDAQGMEIAWAAGWPDYRIEVRRRDGGRRSIRRRRAPRPATLADALTSIGGRFAEIRHPDGTDCRFDLQPAVVFIGYERRVPTYRQLALSPSGEMWVRTWSTEEGFGATDLFGENGGYAGTLDAGAPFPVGFPGPDRILTLETDSLGREDLVVRAVERSRES